MSSYLPVAGTVTVFTTSWCGYCRILRAGLDRAGVTYRDVDIEQEPQAALVVTQANRGNRTVPTVLFPDGSTATNPDAEDVHARLG